MSAFDDQSGKINESAFRQLIGDRCGRDRAEVVRGPRFGVDTAVIDLGGGRGLAVSSDPLSLIPSLGLEESAWLSVHLLANDMATTGCAPQYAQFVLNLPDDFTRSSFDAYWQHIHTFCDRIGVAITGGHTGQVPGQQSTTPGGGTMFLQAPLERILTADGAEAGDDLVVTKECALTASSILALSFPETVRDRCGAEAWQQACDNFYRTSSLPDALAAAETLQPGHALTAMHDVTEGGVLGAIAEMAGAAGCGFRVDGDALPAGPAVSAVCGLFDIDPRRCVGAGSMIMAVDGGRGQALAEALQQQDVPAAVVGTLTPEDEGTVLVEDGQPRPFTFDGTDPYWKAFYNAMEEGWQ